MTSTLPLPPAASGMPLSLSASPHVSHLRPSLTPSPSSSLSLTPLHSSSSSSCSTPQRTSSTSSQSSTASIPARPIRPPPIETRTKASKPEQVWGATSLRDALNASTRGSTTSTNGEGGSDGMVTRGTASGQVSSGAPRGKPAGFVVHGGRRGSGGGSVGNAAGKKIAAGQMIGPSSFKFGEELGRGSFSVVLKGIHLPTSQAYAIKILDKHHLRTHKKEKYATVEVEALKRLSASTSPSSQPPSPTTPRAIPSTPTQPASTEIPKSSISTSFSNQTIRASPTKPRLGHATAGSAGAAEVVAEEKVKEVTKSKDRARGGHPGVVKLFWAFQDESSLYFALDLAPNGEILSLIRQLGSLSVPSARHYVAELVDVVGWMHGRGVLHRDLKPENILLDADFHIKLTDFGSAKVFPVVDGKVFRGDASKPTGGTPAPAAPKPSFVGTAEYVSPEVLLNEPTTESSDMWAIGCILFQLLAGVPPFRGRTEYLTFQKINALEFAFPEGFDPVAKDLVEKLLLLDPTQRLGAGIGHIDAIKSHPFFDGVNFATLFSIPVPPRESGIVGPPEPIRTDFFSGLGLGDVQSDGDDGSEEDGMENAAEDSDFDDTEFEPPKNRWGIKGHQGNGGSVSSGSTMGSSTTTPVNGVGFGRPWSTATTDTSGSSASSNGRSAGERIVSGPWASPAAQDQRSLPLLPGEGVVFSSVISLPSSTLSFSSKSLHLLGKQRERRLVLTDFPRIICVKQDQKTGILKVKSETLILHSGTGSSRMGSFALSGGSNVLKSIKEKGSKGFSIHSTQATYIYQCEDEPLRQRWLTELRKIAQLD